MFSRFAEKYIALRDSDIKRLVPLTPDEKISVEFFASWLSAQKGVHLTAFGVGMLGFVAGFGVCWLAFVR